MFFARDEEIRRLVDRLAREDATILAVVGRSGSGKSSLVHAGLLPRVPERWVVLPSVLLGRDPVRALVRWLVSALADHRVERDLETVLAALEASPARIGELVDDLADAASSTSRRAVVVVVDQAEELHTRAEPEQKRRFLELVGHLAGTQAWVCLVLTLRPDLLSGTPERAGLAALQPETLVLEPVAPSGYTRSSNAPFGGPTSSSRTDSSSASSPTPPASTPCRCSPTPCATSSTATSARGGS